MDVADVNLFEEVLDWLRKNGRYKLRAINDSLTELKRYILNKYNDPSIVPNSSLERAQRRANAILLTPSSFQVLGVSETTASNEEIARCYKKLCLLLHPDKVGDDCTCTQAFLKVGEAKDMLLDASSREKHVLTLQVVQFTDSDAWLPRVHDWIRAHLETKDSLRYLSYRMRGLREESEDASEDLSDDEDLSEDVNLSEDVVSEEDVNVSEAHLSDSDSKPDEATVPFGSNGSGSTRPVPEKTANVLRRKRARRTQSYATRAPPMKNTKTGKTSQDKRPKEKTGSIKPAKEKTRQKDTQKSTCIQIMRNFFVQQFCGDKPAYEKYATVFYKMMHNTHCCRNFDFKVEDDAFADRLFQFIGELARPDECRHLDRGFSFACLTSLRRIGKARCQRAFFELRAATVQTVQTV